MKAILLTLLILTTITLIRFIKSDMNFAAARMLPFLDGKPNQAYTIGGIIMLLMLFYAICKINRNNKDDE
ncbi:MAG: hypothetical protein JEZ07_15010 [Phycisphaerae bacterium]|nr:hypothetical protein [Phycisphaerae bacterium]